MSEFNHPPIDTSSMPNISLEQDFAERAYEILATYSMEDYCEIGTYKVRYPMTDRADMPSADASIETALRLIRHPSFALHRTEQEEATPGSVLLYEPSDEYMVISLQYGTRDATAENEVGVTDEDYEWQPYVTAVSSIHSEPCVLDSQTGKDLDPGDLIQAAYLMELLHGELRNMVFEAAQYKDDIPLVYVPSQAPYRELQEGETLDMNYTCGVCGSLNTPCGCLNSQMN